MVPLDARWRFLAAYAQALHRDGTSAHDLERTLYARAFDLDVPVRVLAAPTVILLSVGPEEAPWTVMLPSGAGHLDIDRHERVEAVAAAVCAGEMEAENGVRALAQPSRPLYTQSARLLASVLLCGAAAPLFGGGAEAVLAAAVGGGVVAVISEVGALHELRVPLASGAASAVSLALASALGADPTASLLGALILLMPGFSLTTATAELATGNLLSGMARAAGAAAVLVQVGLGIALSSALVGRTVGVEETPVPIVAAILATAVAFTVVLGARARLTGWIAAVVLVAWGGSTVASEQLGPYGGAAVAAWMVGMTSNLWARLNNRPPAVLAVPGMLLLVPGATGFRAVVSAMTGDLVVGLDLVLQMGITAFALATGFLAAGLRR